MRQCSLAVKTRAIHRPSPGKLTGRHPQITQFVNGYDISLRTRQGYLTDVRTFFSWCEQKGYCEINPVVAAMPSKAKRKEIMTAKRGCRKLQVLTPTEVQMLLTYCERE